MNKFITILLCLAAMLMPTLANADITPTHEEIEDTTAINMRTIDVISTIKENGTMRQQPSSVTLLDKEQMEAAQVTSLKGASQLVPNLFIPDYGSRLTSAIYIRGIGSRINTSAVGLYVDDIPYADKSAFDFNFYDIEGMDILRGPQGTLYGSNTMGGLVRIRTRNPFLYQGTNLHLGYATGNHRRTASLSHYHRVSNRFAFSAGAYYEGNSGFFTNDLTGKRVDDLQAAGGRLRAIWFANNHWKVDANLSFDHSSEGAYPYYYVGNNNDNDNDNPYIGRICNNRESRYRRNMLNAGANVQYKTERWQMNAITGYQHLRDRMFMDQDFTQQDIYTLEQRQRINMLNEELTFKNLTQGRWEWISGADISYQWLTTEAPVTFYDEGGEWLAGVVNRNMPNVSTIPALSNMGFESMGVNFRNTPICIGGAFDTPVLGAAIFHQSTVHIVKGLSLAVGLRVDYKHNSINYRAHSQIDYGFTLANPRAAMMNINLQDLSAPIHYVGTLKNDYLNVLPKFSLKYDFGHQSNAYFSIAKGIRNGGYNIQMFSDIQQGKLRADMMTGIQNGVAAYLNQMAENYGMPPYVVGRVINIMKENMPHFDEPDINSIIYKPEQSWNYELGTHLNLIDNRLQADAAVFYLHTRDQQIARFAESGMGRRMVNAGKSQSCGAELSLHYRPIDQLSLTANYGYTHATFTAWDMGSSDAQHPTSNTNYTGTQHPTSDTNYTGNYVPFVPQHTVNADAAYTWPFKKGWAKSLTLGINYNGAGRIYWTEDNLHSQRFYSLLGARLSLTAKHATFTLWGKNLTNTRYNTFFFESAGRFFEQHANPLQFGIDVNLHF